jgi:hypothetical protein
VKPYAPVALALAACAVVLLVNCQSARTVAAREAAKQRWEYKEITQLGVSRLGDPDQKTPNATELGLNTLGDEGWELVAVSSNNGGLERYIFKRPK